MQPMGCCFGCNFVFRLSGMFGMSVNKGTVFFLSPCQLGHDMRDVLRLATNLLVAKIWAARAYRLKCRCEASVQAGADLSG